MRTPLSLQLVLPLFLAVASPAFEAGATPPVLDPIGDHSGRPGELMTFVVTGRDDDGDRLALSTSSLPAGATFTDAGNGSGEFRWTPGSGTVGSFPVTFTVLDDGLPPASASETIAISIGNNRAPVLQPIGNRAGDPGVEFSIPVFAMDPDEDPLTLVVSGLPEGARFEDGGDGSGQLDWLPGPNQVGVYTLTFIVTDAGVPAGSDSEQVTVAIGVVNRPPELSPIGDRTALVGVPLVIPLSASDPDQDPLAFSVSGAPLDATLVDHGNGTGEWSWTPPSEGSLLLGLVLTFSVSDGGVPSASDSEEIVVTRGAGNRPPVLGAIGSRTLRVGESLSATITASDLDGDGLRFDATGLPGGATFTDLHDGTAELRWTPTADEVGSHAARVTVTDDGVPPLSAFEEFSLVAEPAVEVPPPASLAIQRARWMWRSSHLRVRGDGAGAGATVSIVDAESRALLAVTTADGAGAFRVNVAPFLAPCGVQARTLDATSEPFAVDGAPADCGRRLYTRIRRAEWLCRHAALVLDATRLPGNATVDVIDAATGATLGSAQANHHGELHARLELASPPARIQLVLRLESAEWTLGTFDVRRARDACARNRWRHGADLERCR
jgi:hypothetical protein